MGLYRLIEFMMIDTDGSGTINMDEVCETFRRRYGVPVLRLFYCMPCISKFDHCREARRGERAGPIS